MKKFYTQSFLKNLYFGAMFVLAFSFGNQLSAQTASFTYTPSNPCVDDTVHFTASTIGWPAGQTYYDWYVSNGTWQSGMSNTFSHKFTSSGTYFVVLSVYDSIQQFFDSTSIQLFVDSICPTNAIEGHVYDDNNGNGMQDPGENAVPFADVELTGNGMTYHSFSNASGDYQINVHPGTYTVSMNAPQYWTVSEPVGGSYSITFTGNGGSSTGNDFGIHAIANVNDLQVSLTGTPCRPGFPCYFWMHLNNAGTTTQSGSASMAFDSKLSFIASTPTASSQSGNTVDFNFTNLLPGGQESYFITLKADSSDSIGTPLVHYATANPVVGDTTPNDNYDTLNQIMVGSYDPNDKQVEPAGLGEFGKILPSDDVLTYVIRFQNKGTFHAENVRIEDVLDPLLDLTTLNVLDASHAFDYEIKSGNKLVWHFNQIMLPDDKTDEPGSHGYVRFSIKIKDANSLPDGTKIKNEASIFFDFNPAIVTNNVINTIDRSIILKIDPIAYNGTVKIHPNPFDGQIVVELDNFLEKNAKMVVFDIQGRIILTELLNQKTQIVNTDQLGKGFYFYQIENDGILLGSGKLIKM